MILVGELKSYASSYVSVGGISQDVSFLMSINIVRRSEARVSASARPSVDLANNTQVPPILNVDGIKLLISESRPTNRSMVYWDAIRSV